MKYSCLTFCLLILCLLLLSHTEVSHAQKPSTVCGPRCLLYICERFNVDATLEELCEISGYDSDDGTSFLGLFSAAKKKGLPVASVTMDIDDLCGLDGPVIAFTEERHFIVVEECRNDSVSVVQPPKRSYVLSRTNFLDIWAGEALVFSPVLSKLQNENKQKTRSGSEPDIHFDQILKDFGVVDQGSVLSHTFQFTNKGDDALTVSVRSSCGCTAALLTDNTILPGEIGKINIEYSTSDVEKGQKTQKIFVRSNDPDERIVTLLLSTTLKGSISIIPERLWLDKVAMNESITREILVFDSGDGTLEIEEIIVPPGISADIGSSREEKSIKVIPVSLSISSPEKSGNFEQLVIIKTNDARRSDIPLRISGEVTSDIYALPDRVYFGTVALKNILRYEIKLSSVTGSDLSINRACSGSEYISVDIKPSEKKSEYTLIAELHAPDRETIIKDSIQIFLSDQDSPTLELPVFARVAR